MPAYAVYSATLPTMLVLHFAADYLLQFDSIARGKRPAGGSRFSALWCALHVMIHVGVQAVGLLALWALLDVKYVLAWTIVGLALYGTAHFWADRRTQFVQVMRATKHGGFLDRYGEAGRHVLDQVWHVACLFPVALIIAQR